jgi:DNA-binding response OmpR family regulator
LASRGDFCEHGGRVTDSSDAIRPTLLMVGRGEAMDAALKVALDRHGLAVLDGKGDIKTSVKSAAPDVVLLVGDAAADGGRAVLDVLATDAVTNVVPVIVLGPAEKLDGRLTAFRAGAVAVVPKTASADQVASRIAAVAREIAERGEARPDELGEATFDELVTMVASELRSGILSVGRQKSGAAGEPMRIVLGAGRPVADAVEEFVRKLRPLVSRAEPLTYELHASAGGPVGLLDGEPAGRGDLSILQGLRIILVDSDASRADTLAQELRSRGSVVAVADPSARGIERARGLDPQVVIVDQAGIDGTGFEVVRAIRRDVRLRWAAMLVAPWAEIWPEHAATPDLAELAQRLAPLVTHDRELRTRATTETKFDARLEITGPSRMLRVLASLQGPFHVVVQSRKASVEVDVAEGLVVGARATRSAGEPIEGTRALAALLVMASARVTVEKRPNPSTANVMAPIEEALARASQEAAPIPVSQPPPPIAAGAGAAALRAGKRSPFPTASDIGRSPMDDDDASGPVRPPPGIIARAAAPNADTTSRDLRWAESEHGAQVPATPPPLAPAGPPSIPQGVFNAKATGVGMQAAKPKPIVRPPGAAASAFGERVVPPPPPKPERGEPTVRVHDDAIRAIEKKATREEVAAKLAPPERPAAPISRPGARKATLVMGAGSPALPPSRPPLTGASPIHPPRSPTVTMGSAELDAKPRPPKAEPATISASVDSEPGSDPLFVDGKQALGSGEHGGASATENDARFDDPTTPELKDPAPVPAKVPARDPAVPASRPRTRSGEGKLEPAPVAPVKPDIEDHAGPIGAFAMSTPPPPTSFAAPPRMDPTPLGVISLPPPQPTAAPVAQAAPPSGARSVAWGLVTLGLFAVLAAGGWVAYLRRDPLMTALGLTPPIPLATTLDAGVEVAEVADAGVLVVALASADAAVVVDDAFVAPDDAFVAPAEDAFVAPVVAEAPDAWTAPPPAPATDETAAELWAQAEHLPPAEAEPLLRRALALDPTEHHAAGALGQILLRRHEAAEAIPLLEVAVRARPGQDEFGIALGDARRDAGDVPGARRAWQAVLAHHPDNATAQARLR